MLPWILPTGVWQIPVLKKSPPANFGVPRPSLRVPRPSLQVPRPSLQVPCPSVRVPRLSVRSLPLFESYESLKSINPLVFDAHYSEHQDLFTKQTLRRLQIMN